MNSVNDMLADREPIHDVLVTMPGRTRQEQDIVWTAGLTKMLTDIARKANRSADRLLERVQDGQLQGLFFDPLDVAEAYAKAELRKSRSREEGERKRQRWLMDILVAIGAARVFGAESLSEYPPAQDLMQQDEAACCPAHAHDARLQAEQQRIAAEAARFAAGFVVVEKVVA